MGSDRDKLIAEADAGSVMETLDGRSVSGSERLAVYFAAPNDAMDFWIAKAEGASGSLSQASIEGCFHEIQRFFLARMLMRIEAGYAPTKALIDISIRFEPELPEPEAMGVETMHRTARLASSETYEQRRRSG